MSTIDRVEQLSAQKRLIVALDVPTHSRALQLVDELDNVLLFKVGLELLLAGSLPDLIREIQVRRQNEGGVFVDLKTAGDIGNTISAMTRQLHKLGVMFLTLAESVSTAITLNSIGKIRAAREPSPYPQILMVPYLSSMDEHDLPENQTGLKNLDAYIVDRARKMLDAGCDGLIASGPQIAVCRRAFPAAVIVSPGIRPDWASTDDHKRITTPAQAITLGSDYLVVGRPITQADNPRTAAQRVIDEVDEALRKCTGLPESLGQSR